MQPMELGNNCTENSYFTIKFAYFCWSHKLYLKEIPLLIHVTMVIFSM